MATIQNLIDLLENKQDWPIGFHWDFAWPSKCAIGLADRVFGRHSRELMLDIKYKLKTLGWRHSPFEAEYQDEIISASQITPKRVARRLRDLEYHYYEQILQEKV